LSTDWILEHIFACFFLYSDNSRAGEGGQRSDYLARPATIPRARAAETEPKGKSYHSAEALPALLALAEGQITDYQKSLALEQAAAAAVALKDFAQAGALAARIPIPAVQRTVEMQNLLAQTKAPQVVAQFAEEDIEKWPFWKRGDGYLVRGRAHLIAKNAKQAGADFAHALEWLGDERSRKAAQQGLQSLELAK
jgi:hypothetical protein